MIPVGVPPVGLLGAGIVTEVSPGNGFPMPSIRDDTPALFSLIQNGLAPEKNATPHGLSIIGSVCSASPGMFETRLVWMYPGGAAGTATEISIKTARLINDVVTRAKIPLYEISLFKFQFSLEFSLPHAKCGIGPAD